MRLKNDFGGRNIDKRNKDESMEIQGKDAMFTLIGRSATRGLKHFKIGEIIQT